MALTHFGFIFTGSGLDPSRDRAVIENPAFRAVLVGMDGPDRAPEVAAEMLRDGVQLIELCGGFSPAWTGKVTEAVGNRIPVGAVSYGPEAIDGMAALFPPA